MKPRRVVLVLAGVVALLLAGSLVKGALIVLSGDRDLDAPATSKLLPLPSGAAVVADRTFESEGSLGADLRVIAFETAAGRGAEAAETYMDGLSTAGWKRFPEAVLSPDAKICTTAVPLDRYLADPERPEPVKQVLRGIDRPPERIGVITAIFC